MIFDSHMHVGDFPLFNVSLDREGLGALMRETGISEALLFSPDNELVRSIAEELPGVWALYWANPNRPEAIGEAHAYLEHPRFRGIKFHPLLDSYHPNDPSVHPFMQLAGDRGLPVLFHTGHPIFTLPWSIEEVAANFPDTNVVFGHMGHGNVVYINASIDIACRRPNVYLETSGMPMHTKIREAVERVGAGSRPVRLGRPLPPPRGRAVEGAAERTRAGRRRPRAGRECRCPLPPLAARAGRHMT